MRSVGEELALAMKEREWQIFHLQSAMHDLGEAVPTRTIENWLADISQPSFKHAGLLHRIFGLDRFFPEPTAAQ